MTHIVDMVRPDYGKDGATSQEPRKVTTGSAGFDLFANNPVEIAPRATALVTTGVHMAIPMGMVGMVCSRSGMALKHSVFVLNAPGIIDSDYRGDVGVILHNAGDKPYKVETGDAIAQLLFIQLPDVSFADISHEAGDRDPVRLLGNSSRGAGGFGSTGK